MGAFRHTVQPRYVETDQGGRIHHGALVPWLEEARVAFLAQAGIAYHDVEAKGLFLVVRSLEIRYSAPLHFGAAVTVETCVIRQGRASVDFGYTLTQNGVVCATARTDLACVNRNGKPSALPAQLASHISS